MQNTPDNLSTFLLITTFLIMLMGVFILTIIFAHRRKQISYQQKIKEIEANYEKNMLQTQLEIQEQTFQHISREIHDNISLSLTLAKLNLNTVKWEEKQKSQEKIGSSIDLLSKSIMDLRGISQSLNADIIFQQGLIKAIDEEVKRIRQSGLFELEFDVKGVPVFLAHQKELVIFRVVQEAFNNIIKHAKAKKVKLLLQYYPNCLIIYLKDDGLGFDPQAPITIAHSGLKNMDSRLKMLRGLMEINSWPGKGTAYLFNIPFD